MDDDYASSENEQDELMEDADELEAENEADEDNEEEEEDQDEQDEPEPEQEMEPEAEAEAEAEPFDGSQPPAADGQAAAGEADTTTRVSVPPTTPLSTSRWRPVLLQEYIDAPLYDIVPTMAAPQATSINAMAITPDLRYWMTGGSDGYIRKYDGMGTINGKQQLTVAQRHPFVDSVQKAGILMSYWENEEPAPPNARPEDRILSPVYSLAVHSGALWLLSGLESGGINLQSVRYDEGKRIHCLRDGGHTNAVSVLQLAPDERSVLSGSWDKTVLDWDLDNGHIIRRFDGIGGQISAIELRPASGAPIPAEASEIDVKSETFFAETRPRVNGFFTNGATDGPGGSGHTAGNGEGPAGDASGSPEHESLFGSPAGSLFGDNDTMGGGGGGGGAFGDDDDEFSRAMGMDMHDQSGDFTMGDTDMSGGPGLDLGTTAAADAPLPTQEPTITTQTDSHGDISTVDTANSGTLPDLPMDFSQAPTAAADASQQSAPAPLPDQQQPPPPTQSPEEPTSAPQQQQQQPPSSPSLVFSSAPAPPHADPSQTSSSTFLSAAQDGTIRIWDRRVPDPVARINPRRGVPPWCMGACWSPDGNWLYAGRRNGCVEEFSLHKATSSWQAERALKFPAGSGAVSCVRPMPNGRHLVCASHDILRLYDLQQNSAFKHSKVPFIIVPGPPRAGVTAGLYIDPTSRVMISIAGTRGWDGTSTEVLIGYEISVSKQ